MDSRQLQLVLTLQDNLTKELRKLDGQLSGVEKSGMNVGGAIANIAKAFAAAGAAAGAFALKAFADFEKFNFEIERAGAFVNASADEMKLFRSAAIDAARGTTFSFNEAAAALGNFVGGEIDAATASKELGGVIDLALVAKLDDLQQAVNIAGTALSVFKNDGMEMSDVIDIIATVAADVTTETDKWATALVNSSGAAKAAGFSFKDLNVLFSAMVRGGADANLMWSAFNSAITRVQAPTKQTVEALEAVGLSAAGLAEATRKGPIEMLQYLREGFEEAEKAGVGFAFLTDTIGSQAAPEFALALGLTNEELAETAAYFGEIDGRGAVMVDRLREAVPATQYLKQAFSELMLQFGAYLNDNTAMGEGIRMLGDGMRWLANNVQNVDEFFGAFRDKAIEMFTLFDEKTLILTHFNGVFAGLGEVWNTQIKPALVELGATLVELRPFWEALATVIGFTLVAAMHVLIAAIGIIGEAFGNLIAIITRLIDFAFFGLDTWIGYLSNMFTIFGKLLTGDFAGAWIAVKDAVADLVGWFGKAYDKLKSLIDLMADSGIGGSIAKLFQGRASGGSVAGGTPYIVGENGPEVFRPNVAGSIMPNYRLAAGMGGGGTGITVNVYGDVTGEEIIDKVERGLASRIKERVRVT